MRKANPDCYVYSHPNAYTYGDINANPASHAIADAENCANNEASPHPSAAAVTFADEEEAHCSIS